MTAYTPKVDEQLVVDLPGERLRATCRQVTGDDEIVVELTTMPMAKSHMHKLGERVHAVRGRTELTNEEIWRVTGTA
jgi:hypothetical protein